MLEEFHAEQINGMLVYKQLYGWNTLNTSVWLPSLSELVGVDSNTYYEPYGCYYSAMQGMNTSFDGERPYVDIKGGIQFSYFQQYNASGGGTMLWNACAQEAIWIRSCTIDTQTYTWRFTNAQRFDWGVLTDTYAVHPAVEYAQSRPKYKKAWNFLHFLLKKSFLSCDFVL